MFWNRFPCKSFYKTDGRWFFRLLEETWALTALNELEKWEDVSLLPLSNHIVHFFKMLKVVVQIAICICANCKIYLHCESVFVTLHCSAFFWATLWQRCFTTKLMFFQFEPQVVAIILFPFANNGRRRIFFWGEATQHIPAADEIFILPIYRITFNMLDHYQVFSFYLRIKIKFVGSLSICRITLNMLDHS